MPERTESVESDSIKLAIYQETKDGIVPYGNLYFKNVEAATRVAKALTHAVEVCGGGDNDPF
ncbi:hypothetical protein P3T20_002262 [Paraburkholderia sp. GAS206C]|uniref:hypothetical protein n=1 Tax=unclassified Paraburkholderia TaxID=2615204 RepID=UPI003D1F70E3